MNRKEKNASRYKPPEVRERERQEDIVFNKMLQWLVAAVIAEAVMLLLNRFYIHARVSELGAVPALSKLLLVFPVIGIVAFVLCLFWRKSVRNNGKSGDIQLMTGGTLLCIGVCGFLLRMFGSTGSSVVLAITPVLAVLILIYYLYQKEFFGCAILGALSILGLWVYRVAGNSSTYFLCLILTVVVAAVGVALSLKLKKTDGVLTVKGRELALLTPDASYMAFYISAVVALVLLLCPLALGAAVAYYSIWAIIAGLFILAVYFTSKLM